MILRVSAAVLCLASALAPSSAQSPSSGAESIPSAPSANAPGTTPAQPNLAQSGPAPRSAEFDRAEAALAKGDWKTAAPLLDAWLAGHPSDARALFDAAFVADEQNREADAVSLYRRCIALQPKNFAAQASLGLLLARMGNLADARPVLAAATQLDPGSAGKAALAQVWRALAQIDRTGINGHPNDAQASSDLLQALKLSPETPQDTLMAAGLAEASGDAAGAEAAYRSLLAADPDSVQAIGGLAHALIVEKKYPDAEALLRPALAKHPGNIPLTAQLAAVLVAEDKAEAIPLLQQLHASNPSNEEIARMLARVQADAGDFTSADALDVALLRAHPQDADLLTSHGQNLMRLGQFAAASAAFQQAAAIDPTNVDAWTGLAFTASELHQPQVTIQALTQRNKLQAENAPVDFLLATAYDHIHDRKSALFYYQRFVDLDAGKLKDQEWQAKQRIDLLQREH